MTALTAPLALRLYQGAGFLAPPLLRHFLARRVRRGKESEARLGERWGRAAVPRPEGRLVWLHAASVGETLSVLSLVGRLTEAGLRVLLTTGTVTSAELAATRLPEGALHQFVPLDVPAAARRFLDHWRPDLALFCESEIWPTLMLETRRRGIPLGIVNGRMSARSFAKWHRLPGIARSLLGGLAFCLAQSEGDAQRYAALGAPSVSSGNLKFDAAPPPVDAGALDQLRRAIGPRPVFVAASTHPGEEMAVLEAAARIRDREPDLLTILVPRHPARGAEIEAACRAGGLHPLMRGKGEAPDDLAPLYVADTLGELGLFYSLASLAFIGGSLVPVGGHNPIEPAKIGAPILTGPHVGNFTDVFAAFSERGACEIVANPSALAETAIRLLGDDVARLTLAKNARRIAEANAGALTRTLEAIAAILPEAGSIR